MLSLNQWPNEKEDTIREGFRDGLVEYQSAIIKVAQKLLVAFAISLEHTNEKFFVDCTTKPMSTLRLLHYPPQQPKDLVTVGCGLHTDYGSCTLLNQDDIGGLQVLNSREEWIKAPPLASSLVVNLGDMMSRWTSNVYRSTVHRVVNVSGKERYCIPFLFESECRNHSGLLAKLLLPLSTS